MKKVLVIPSHFVDPNKMKVRTIEFARCLSSRYQVYLLTWNASISARFMPRILSCIKDLFKRTRLKKFERLHLIQMPLMHRPLSVAVKFNSFFLNRFIKRERIECLINGSYHMFQIPAKRDFRYIVDLADLPTEDDETSFDRFIRSLIAREISKADSVTVVSKGLEDFVETNYSKKALVVHNGAYLKKIRSIDSSSVADLRQSLNLNGKWVIGYTGLIGPWVETGFLVDVFKKLKQKMPDAALLFVGPSPDLEGLRKRFAKEGVIFTGAVIGDIGNYLHLIDCPVLIHKKNTYQDLAFHIKLIEYSAARKIVVSTALEEAKRLNLPNIILADLKIEDWVLSISKAREAGWQKQWDGLLEGFDWEEVVQKFYPLIEAR